MKNLEDPKNTIKGILTTSKPNLSKGRRISWGEAKVKEYTKNEEVNNQSGDEYNMNIISGSKPDNNVNNYNDEKLSNNKVISSDYSSNSNIPSDLSYGTNITDQRMNLFTSRGKVGLFTKQFRYKTTEEIK